MSENINDTNTDQQERSPEQATADVSSQVVQSAQASQNANAPEQPAQPSGDGAAQPTTQPSSDTAGQHSTQPASDAAARPTQTAQPGAAPQQPAQAASYAAAAPAQQAQPAGAAYQMPLQPQAAYPAGAAASAQPKRKVWPWVLLACLLAFLIGLGGCAGCTAIGMLLGTEPVSRDNSLHQYDYDDLPYSYDSSTSSSDTYGGFTLDDIRNAAGTLTNDVDEGKAASGAYVVGKDIDAGYYFLQGMTSQEGNFYVFTPEGSGTYSLKASIVYVGHYFYNLEEGQVIVFMPAGNDLRMIPSDQADFNPSAPYSSGLYRVGEDIPAGTYTITVSDDAPRSTTQEYATYVMKDLEFSDDSILDTKYLLKGSKQTVTVEEGQLLELYGCTATPAN